MPAIESYALLGDLQTAALVSREALRDRNVDLDEMTVQVDHGAYEGELVPVKTRASRRRVDLSSTAARLPVARAARS